MEILLSMHFINNNLLQQEQLEACYREANLEIDDAFDCTTSDGLLFT